MIITEIQTSIQRSSSGLLTRAGQPFFRGAGRGGAGRTSLLGRSRKKNLCKKASQIKITFEAAALLPARVVILICEHIAATEGAPSPQPDMAAPSLITAFTPLPPNAPGRGFFWKPTAWLKINVLDNSSQAGSAICHPEILLFGFDFLWQAIVSVVVFGKSQATLYEHSSRW